MRFSRFLNWELIDLLLQWMLWLGCPLPRKSWSAEPWYSGNMILQDHAVILDAPGWNLVLRFDWCLIWFIYSYPALHLIVELSLKWFREFNGCRIRQFCPTPDSDNFECCDGYSSDLKMLVGFQIIMTGFEIFCCAVLGTRNASATCCLWWEGSIAYRNLEI